MAAATLPLSRRGVSAVALDKAACGARAGKRVEPLTSSERAAASDEILATAVKTGDGAAFRILVERYERPLHAFLVRVTGDANGADDVFQETFIRVLKSIGRYEDGRPFRPWLYTIALNQARNSFRRTRREPRVSIDAALGGGAAEGRGATLSDALASAVGSPVEAASQGEAAALVREAVAALTGAGREALVLFYFEGLSYEEVAEVLSIPLGTVKSRIHNALAKLVVVIGSRRASLGPRARAGEPEDRAEVVR